MDTQIVAVEERMMLPERTTLQRSSSSGASFGSYPAVPDAELEFDEVWSALIRRRKIIVAFTVLGLFIGLLTALLTKHSYNATATVEFAQPNSRAFGLDDPSYNASDLSSLELLNTELKTQQTEITDDATALAVIQQLHLATRTPFAIPDDISSKSPLSRERGLPLDRAPYQRERVIKLFQQKLSVDVVKGTRLLNITFTDSDPVMAATVANAVVTASVDQTSGRHSTAFLQVSSWLTDQLASLKQRVEDSQKIAEEYENENQRDLAGMTVSAEGTAGQNGRTVATNASESVPVSRLLALNNELTSAQVARIAKEAIYRVAETGDPDAVLSIGSSSLVSGPGADSALAPGNGGLGLLQHLREQEVQLNVQTATAATRYGAKNPAMVEYHNQQAAIQTQMSEELRRIRERARTDLDLATRAEDGLHAQVTAQQQEVSQWTTKADHLLLLQGEAASSRALYQDLFAKLEESQFAAGIQASRVTVLDPARIPMNPSTPNKRQDLALGLLTGVVFGLISALLIELLDDSLHSVEQVRKAFGAPVLGSIPKLPRGLSPTQAWVVSAPRSAIAEAYRSFRTAAFASPSQAQCHTLLIASPCPADSKATTCFNAAAALAVQGHRVLMLSADMRCTTAWVPTGISPSLGLSRCLAGELTPQQVVQPSPEVQNLFVLPAGPVPDNASELLGSNRFNCLLDELKTQFEYILVDSPPALLFSDTKILSSSADGFVLVVHASSTPKRDLRRALDDLYGSSAAFVGILLNAVEAKAPRYSKFGYGS